jgi:hypothetical protein
MVLLSANSFTKIVYFCNIKAKKTLHMLQVYYLYLHGSFFFRNLKLSHNTTPYLYKLCKDEWGQITVRAIIQECSLKATDWSSMPCLWKNNFGASVDRCLFTAFKKTEYHWGILCLILISLKCPLHIHNCTIS